MKRAKRKERKLYDFFLWVSNFQDIFFSFRSARSSKRRKYEEVPTGQEDIFADLLDLKERQSSEDSKLFQPELSSQQNAFPLSIGENQRLCDLDAEIMDIVVCEEILVVLVECEDVAYIKVFILEGNQAKCIQSFATGVEKKLFFQGKYW